MLWGCPCYSLYHQLPWTMSRQAPDEKAVDVPHEVKCMQDDNHLQRYSLLSLQGPPVKQVLHTLVKHHFSPVCLYGNGRKRVREV